MPRQRKRKNHSKNKWEVSESKKDADGKETVVKRALTTRGLVERLSSSLHDVRTKVQAFVESMQKALVVTDARLRQQEQRLSKLEKTTEAGGYFNLNMMHSINTIIEALKRKEVITEEELNAIKQEVIQDFLEAELKRREEEAKEKARMIFASGKCPQCKEKLGENDGESKKCSKCEYDLSEVQQAQQEFIDRQKEEAEREKAEQERAAEAAAQQETADESPQEPLPASEEPQPISPEPGEPQAPLGADHAE